MIKVINCIVCNCFFMNMIFFNLFPVKLKKKHFFPKLIKTSIFQIAFNGV